MWDKMVSKFLAKFDKICLINELEMNVKKGKEGKNVRITQRNLHMWTKPKTEG